MAITLVYSGTTVILPDAMNWIDEYSWSPVQQSSTYTVTGALILESAVKQAGRPITLQGAEDRTWLSRTVVDTLHAWAALPSTAFTLTLRGVSRQVAFDHERGALQGLPVMFYDDDSISGTDFYVPTLKFLEV